MSGESATEKQVESNNHYSSSFEQAQVLMAPYPEFRHFTCQVNEHIIYSSEKKKAPRKGSTKQKHRPRAVLVTTHGCRPRLSSHSNLKSECTWSVSIWQSVKRFWLTRTVRCVSHRLMPFSTVMLTAQTSFLSGASRRSSHRLTPTDQNIAHGCQIIAAH